MAKTYSVAVLGRSTQEEGRWMMHYALQAFDLTADKLCTLLENPDTTDLGVEPRMNYQVMGGGRFWPSASRQEVAKVMRGVDTLVLVVQAQFIFRDVLGRTFYRALIEENALERCKHVIVRIVQPETAQEKDKKIEDTDLTSFLKKRFGVDVGKFADKFHLISDIPMEKKSSKAKTTGVTQDPEQVKQDIASLRLTLAGQEVREKVVQPVKETVTAGKSLLDLGQRLVGWMTAGREVAASAA